VFQTSCLSAEGVFVHRRRERSALGRQGSQWQALDK
jgi:hypothetical protein